MISSFKTMGPVTGGWGPRVHSSRGVRLVAENFCWAVWQSVKDIKIDIKIKLCYFIENDYH